MNINLHSYAAIPWHSRRAHAFEQGLKKLGFSVTRTSSRQRINSDPCVLFGTSLWQDIEADRGDWLLVDRASFDNPNSVQLVWNGRLRHGNHMVPADYRDRPRAIPEIEEPRIGKKRILCGQFSSNGAAIDLYAWYKETKVLCSHFKPHPAMSTPQSLGLPVVDNFDDCYIAHTLNSSVAVELLIKGVAVVVDDPSGMAYDYSAGKLSAEEMLKWIAWTQFTWQEIEQGEQIAHLFDWLRAHDNDDQDLA